MQTDEPVVRRNHFKSQHCGCLLKIKHITQILQMLHAHKAKKTDYIRFRAGCEHADSPASFVFDTSAPRLESVHAVAQLHRDTQETATTRSPCYPTADHHDLSLFLFDAGGGSDAAMAGMRVDRRDHRLLSAVPKRGTSAASFSHAR